jgi:hypothetical protein
MSPDMCIRCSHLSSSFPEGSTMASHGPCVQCPVVLRAQRGVMYNVAKPWTDPVCVAGQKQALRASDVTGVQLPRLLLAFI